MLRETYTVVIVTHNLQQAGRIADRTAFFMLDRQEKEYIGMLVEENETTELFARPRDARTQDYIQGRIG
jgi:phosphate transport system ATP-binding protein